jgi:hypothetical protein
MSKYNYIIGNTKLISKIDDNTWNKHWKNVKNESNYDATSSVVSCVFSTWCHLPKIMVVQ